MKSTKSGERFPPNFGDDPRRLMAHYAEYEKQLEREGWRFAEAPVEKPEEEMVLRDKPPGK